MKRLELIKTFLENKRLEEYNLILKMALSSKYSLISLKDYFLNRYNSPKIIILRHDVDYESIATLKMFEIEKELSVKSSYYFRKSTYDFHLMKEIEKYGSEASLHFETVSDFAKENNISTKVELNKYNWKEICQKKLKTEIDFLRKNYGLSCKTIASHGDPVNNLIETANYYLTYEDNSYENLGIYLEAYNQKFIKSLDVYVSDDSPEINNGYHYNNNIKDEIRRERQKILFLTHPNHWYWDNKTKIKKIIKTILYGQVNKINKFDLF